MWVGAPGEPIPSGLAFRVKDPQGEPLAGATVTWEAMGRDARILSGSSQTNAKGLATAGWQLGTDAAEVQQLRVEVRWAQRRGEVTIRARAVPHVVAQLHISVDTPAVFRLGDSIPIGVTAIDPYGNAFGAPNPAVTVEDTAIGRVSYQTLIAGPRRGTTRMIVKSDRLTASIPIQVTQRVASIHPASDTLYFTSLKAERPLQYVLTDDKGGIVSDTFAMLSVADTAIAQLTSSGVQALNPGTTTLHLTVGSISASTVVNVQQRVASLALRRDTIRFDALLDTTTIYAIARDSLGSPIPQPAVIVQVGNGEVAKVAGEHVVQALTPGITVLTLVDPATGTSVSAPVVVEQRTATIELSPLAFEALDDTLPIQVTARDRLGSLISNPALEYSVSDSTIATLEAGNRIRSIREGQFALTIRDPETGASATTDISVSQRVTALQLSADTLSFDALTDSLPVGFTAWDKRGIRAASARIAYSSTNPSVVTVGSDGAVRSVGNGAAFVIGQSPDGPADTIQVAVAQRVVRIELGQDSLLFESLHAVRGAWAHPVDRLGAVVASAPLSYAVEDSRIAEVDGAGEVRALANGTTGLLLVVGPDTSRVGLRVTQRPVRVALSADTVRFQAFGDSVTLGATAVDSLGSPVAGGIAGVVLADPTIAVVTDSSTVHATGNGTTHATVTVAGITGQAVVEVDQVPTALTVNSTFGGPVITLAPGAPFPLSCQAVDRNGYAIGRDPILVGTRKGTVAGSGCADATVVRSGYDTLMFRLGQKSVSVPVIVATAPDSVGVITAAESLPSSQRIRFEGEDLSNPAVLALRPLVQDILVEYGNPSTALGRARALRDWVARTAVHPHPPLHPDGSTANLAVLPPSNTWADVNAIIYRQSNPDSMTQASNVYWQAVGYDGYAMLNRLLGTLDTTTGIRADDGMMVHIGGARYRIRDIEAYHYPICTFQAIMLNALWAAAGLQGMLSSTIDHDPAAVFISDLNKWVYEDPTFNEEYALDGAGDPLSPTELLQSSSTGDAARLRPQKMPGPSVDPEPYGANHAYIDEHPAGMTIMGSQLNNRVVGVGGWSTRLVQIDVPQLASSPLPYSNPNTYAPVPAQYAFPVLGAVIDSVEVQDSVFVVHLSSTFPDHARFERRLGATWATVSSVDVLPVGQCRVEYRSIDSQGNYSATTIVDVWAPRDEGFLQTPSTNGPRTGSVYCLNES
jgi:hypothetical protein